ncbi:MAG: sulfur globule protein CV1 [Gammaproteobacteria bacterium]|jgi:hypothetical protein
MRKFRKALLVAVLAGGAALPMAGAQAWWGGPGWGGPWGYRDWNDAWSHLLGDMLGDAEFYIRFRGSGGGHGHGYGDYYGYHGYGPYGWGYPAYYGYPGYGWGYPGYAYPYPYGAGASQPATTYQGGTK